MADEDDILDEGGLEPADEPDAPDVGAEGPEEAPDAPVTFTAEQLAEHLPQFQERFLAHHDPTEALALYGQRDRNVQAALTRYTQGNSTDDDVATLRESGYEIPEPQEETVEPLWGAPWAEPTTMDEFYALANARPADAMAFVDANPGRVNDETRLQVLNHWASLDAAAAIAYETSTVQKREADAREKLREEMREEWRRDFGDVREKYEADTHQGRVATVDLLAATARTEIPDFLDHEKGVIEILTQNVNQDPTYLERLLSLPMQQQLQHISDLTGAAAWRNRPQAQADADAEAEAAEARKVGAAGQRGRGAAGASGGPQSDLKRQHLAAFERLKDVDVSV